MSVRKLIIIGAPRSGTNMLRDILVKLEGVGTWPCDEINYIWRHGNVREATDEFGAELATDSVKRYIRHEFNALAKKYHLEVVVEKTCANSLRVPFVDHIIPEAIYIYIYRDGIDVVGSALKRWKARLDVPYLLRKARYVPIIDLPYYAIRYLGNRVYRLFSKERRLASWGPRFEGVEEALKTLTLEETCALQWKRCVELSEQAFSKITSDRVVRVQYEAFVTNPVQELKTICHKAGLIINDEQAARATRSVSARSIGRARQTLEEGQINRVRPLISDVLKFYGYD